MSILRPYRLPCPCGTTVVARLAEGVNVARLPQARAQILEGRFHRVVCDRCDRVLTVEKPFSYVDLERNTVIEVEPRDLRHTWREASGRLHAAVRHLPGAVSPTATRHVRVVFGLAE